MSCSKPAQKPCTRKSTLSSLARYARPEAGKLAIAMVALVASSTNNMNTPRMIGKIVDAACRPSTNGSQLSSVVTKAVIFFSMGAVASWIRVYFFHSAKERVANKLRQDVFDALMRQDTEKADTTSTANLAQLLSEDVSIASRIVTADIARGLRSLSSTIGGSAMLMRISPHLTMVSLSILPLVGASAMLFGRFVKRQKKRHAEVLSAAHASATECASHLHTVRLNAQELHAIDRFRALVEQSRGPSSTLAAAEGLLMGGLFACGGLSLVAVIVMGGRQVQAGVLSPGSLTQFGVHSGMLALGVAGLVSFIAEYSKSLVCAQRVLDILQAPKPVCPLEAGATPSHLNGDLSFSNLVFSYSSRPDVRVLNNVSLSISRGQVVGIVGPSGCGKSTLASLLVRLYELQSGEIAIDGQDIRTLSPLWLRQKVCVVEQHPAMFTGTIEQNIRFGSQSASKEELDHALEVADLTSFIENLPTGLATLVGEKGVQLSGGETQKIAIARAVLRKPSVLVLDESTSNVDGESEKRILQALQQEMKGHTMIVIAHRPSMVRDADFIVVLKKGEVVEQGKFDELLKSSSILPQLMQSAHDAPSS